MTSRSPEPAGDPQRGVDSVEDAAVPRRPDVLAVGREPSGGQPGRHRRAGLVVALLAVAAVGLTAVRALHPQPAALAAVQPTTAQDRTDAASVFLTVQRWPTTPPSAPTVTVQIHNVGLTPAVIDALGADFPGLRLTRVLTDPGGPVTAPPAGSAGPMELPHGVTVPAGDTVTAQLSWTETDCAAARRSNAGVRMTVAFRRRRLALTVESLDGAGGGGLDWYWQISC